MQSKILTAMLLRYHNTLEAFRRLLTAEYLFHAKEHLWKLIYLPHGLLCLRYHQQAYRLGGFNDGKIKKVGFK